MSSWENNRRTYIKSATVLYYIFCILLYKMRVRTIVLLYVITYMCGVVTIKSGDFACYSYPLKVVCYQ